MTALVRVVLCLFAIAAASACTPVRSKVPPPYVIGGREFSADEFRQYAVEQCRHALEYARSPAEKPGLPTHAFTTDGCSAWPESRAQGCCLEHDVAYWCGVGSRREIDLSFRRCLLRETGSKVYAAIAYTGVRLGGGRFMPFSWRFGYGHDWPHRRVDSDYRFEVLAESESRPQNPLTIH
jgi:hypothetical protein